jgi:hypothetical protein
VSFNRPNPSKALREKAYEVMEGVSEETSVFWNDLDVVILGEYRVWNLYEDDHGVTVLVRTLGHEGWEDYEDADD